MNPWISILVPVYQVEDYIERCARSVFEQTYENVEYIFCDDCSPDGSIEVLNHVMKDYPVRAEHTRIIRFDHNSGHATARNTLVKSCQTDWLMFMDADDWVEPDIVENLVKKQQETGADLVISDFIIHLKKEDRRFSYPDFEKKDDYLTYVLSTFHSACIWGRLIQRSLYIDNDLFVETSCQRYSDMRAFIPLVYYAHYIAVLHEWGYHYDTTRPGSVTKKDWEINVEQRLHGFALVRAFVKEKIPEHLWLFDSNRYYPAVSTMLNEAAIKGKKRAFQQLSQIVMSLIRKYPFLVGSLKERLKWRVKCNYFLYHSFLKYVNR